MKRMQLMAGGLCLAGILFAGYARPEAATQTEEIFRPGTWIALSDDNEQFYNFYEDGMSGATVSLDNGMGAPFNYEWEDGQVNFYMGAADVSRLCKVTEIDENHLALEWDTGEVDNLSYYTEADLKDMHFFTNEELCDLGLDYYQKVNGLETFNLSAATASNEDGTVTIQIYENQSDHNSTAAWYLVDRFTGTGQDVNSGNSIKIINGTPEISISYADSEQLQNLASWEECIIDESEYHSDILLTPELPVTDFSVVSIEWIPGENEEDNGFRVNEQLYFLDKFMPEMPLLVKLTLPEVVPNIGIQYVNQNGETCLYSVCMSGIDGSPLLVEENVLS